MDINRRKANELSLNRLVAHNLAHDCICMTAFRSDREEDKEGRHKRKAYVSNQQANHALGEALRELGYQTIKVIGKYKETIERDGEVLNTGRYVQEVSWFVVNVKDGKDFLAVCADLAEKDNQDSILVIPRGKLRSGNGCFLYGTTTREDAWVPYHRKMACVRMLVGKADVSTQVNGKEFSFDLASESSGIKCVGFGSNLVMHDYIRKHYGIDLR